MVWSASYSAFGQARVEVETVTNNLRFPGQYFDAETGLHYNWHRYYAPGIGRYLRTDPIGFLGGDHFYTYTFNPLRFIDPLGLSKATGVKMCFRIIHGEATPEGYPGDNPFKLTMWHVYFQIGNSWEDDWTVGFDGQIYAETREKEKHRNDARFCNPLKKRFFGHLPNGTPCRCATPEQIQKLCKR